MQDNVVIVFFFATVMGQSLYGHFGESKEVKHMRRSLSIRFTDYDMIEMFSRDIANLKGEFDIVSGRKVVDAKSFLGIFSLDLSVPLTLNAVTDDDRAFIIFQKYAV